MTLFATGLYVLPVLWYVRTDFALYGGDWPHLRQRLLSRVIALAGSLVAFVVLPRLRSRRAYSNFVFGYATWVALFMVVINGLRPQGGTLPLRTPLFALFLLYGALPNSFWRQCAPAWLLSLGLVVLRLTWVTSGSDGDIGGDIVIVLIVNAFGILLVKRRLALEQDTGVAWQAEHEARVTVEHTLAELHTLRGIIPICSHCKKVRSEVGDWEQIESYVRSRSEAEFSHGICPDCLKVHYPDSLTEARHRGFNDSGSD